MRYRSGTALCAAALLCAAPAAAQETPVRSEVTGAVDMIVREMTPLFEAAGVPADRFMSREHLTGPVAEALPLLNADRDIDGEWDTSVHFEFDTTHAPEGLPPEPDGLTVLDDARNCVEEDKAFLEVVHFRRYVREEMRGYQCVLLFKGVEPGTWVLVSRGFAEGGGRRMSGWLGVGMNTPADDARARQALIGRIEGVVALSAAIDDYALALFLMRDRADGPLSQDEALARLDRVRRALESSTPVRPETAQ